MYAFIWGVCMSWFYDICLCLNFVCLRESKTNLCLMNTAMITISMINTAATTQAPAITAPETYIYMYIRKQHWWFIASETYTTLKAYGSWNIHNIVGLWLLKHIYNIEGLWLLKHIQHWRSMAPETYTTLKALISLN